MSDVDGNDFDNEGDGDEPEVEAPKRTSGKKKNGVGAVPSTPPKFHKDSNEADQVWNDIVQWLPSQNLDPYAISIQVKRIAPPATTGGAVPMRSFGAEAVAGGESETPGSALIQYITQYIHLQTTNQPATYDVYFLKKANGAQIAVGRLNLPDAAQCMALIRGGEYAQAQAGQGAGVGAPQRFQPPPFQPPPAWRPEMPQQPQPLLQQPPPYYPQPGYGAPAPQQPPAVPPQMMEMMGAMMGELLAAAREGRQPTMPQAGIANPIGGMSEADVDRIAAKVAFMMGAGQPRPVAPQPPAPTPPAPTVAATPAPNPTDDLTGFARGMVNDMLRMTFETIATNVKKSVQHTASGLGAVPQVEEPEAPAEIVPPEDPKDAVPWTVADVGSTWGNGSPVKIALDKESGNIDPMGVVFANPAIAEKAMDILNGLGQAAQEFMKSRSGTAGPPPAPAAHVVREIPAGARDAGGNGNGWSAP